MNAILGLLDSLEATILEGKKIPLTDKIILEEKTILSIIDKIRLAVNSQGEIVQQSVDRSNKAELPISTPESEKTIQEFKKIKEGATEYADTVLANLLLMVTKMQKNLMNIEHTIENGRKVLDTNHAESAQKGEPRNESLQMH